MSSINKCPICSGEMHQYAKFCKRCWKFIKRLDRRARANRSARIEALKRSWNGNNFICYYSGQPLNEDNHTHPLYLTFDHKIPRDQKEIVIAAACINDMKSDMSEEEFKNIVIDLAKVFKGSKKNCRNIFDLKFWKR